MPSWTEIAEFCLAVYFAAFTTLHFWALFRPGGEVSRYHHTSFPDGKEKALLRLQPKALEDLVEQGKQPQPDPLVDLELVTTVRRNPRRTRTNTSQ